MLGHRASQTSCADAAMKFRYGEDSLEFQNEADIRQVEHRGQFRDACGDLVLLVADFVMNGSREPDVSGIAEKESRTAPPHD